MNTNQPIFILGNPRSGTTLLRVVINAHNDLVVPPECGFALWFFDAFGQKDFMNDSVVKTYLREVFLSKKFETWNIDLDSLIEFVLSNRKTGKYAEIVSLVYGYYAQQNSTSWKRWGDKNNFYIDYIPQILALYPQAQFIHIVRDGRDVGCSYRELSKRAINSKYKPILPTTIVDIANEWVDNNLKIERQLKALPDHQHLTIRYEDLVRHIQDTSRKICTFLNIPYDQNMTTYYNHDSKEPVAFLQWKQKITQKPDVNNLERYKEDLSSEEISAFNKVAGSLLTSYGY